MEVKDGEHKPNRRIDNPHLSKRNSLTILDGGTGHLLKQRGVITSDNCFLAGLLANENQPQIVESIHRDYLQVGCEVITTNSFVAVPSVMTERSAVTNEMDAEHRTKELITASVQRARNASGTTRCSIAGTIPPLTECYVSKAVPQNTLLMIPTYELILTTLIEQKVNLLLAETLSTSREALAIIQALQNIQERTQQQQIIIPPLWISFTIDDDNNNPTPLLRSGETLRDAFQSVFRITHSSKHKIQLDAIGVNCSSPDAITTAIPTLVSVAKEGILSPTPRILAYGNAFQTTTSDWLNSLDDTDAQGETTAKGGEISVIDFDSEQRKIYDEDGFMIPGVYAHYAQLWVDSGASIIGGCCGCGPCHMKAVIKQIQLSNV